MRARNDIDEKFQNAVDLHNHGKLLDAQKAYEDVLTLNPNHFDALQLLGLASYQIGQFDRAVELILKAIAFNDKSAFAHKNLGDAFERLNRLDDAIASYNKSILLKPDYLDAYNNLGVALNELKRHMEALASFEKAIRLKPDFRQAHHNREIAIADLSQWGLAFDYQRAFGVWPRLNPPVSFNERILHRIIYDRDPKLRIVCDKLAVRQLIGERVGVEYVVPLLGVWERPREIAWHILPQNFVLKPSHASGPFAVVDQSVGVNKEQLTAEAEQWLAYDYFDKSLEWGYRGIPRCILAEPFLLSPNGGAAPEAQVYAFSGKAVLINILVGTKHSPERSGSWFDVTGRRVAIKRTGRHAEFELSDRDRQKMVEIAERVSQDFSSLRVDFFMAINGLKIGELSPYTLSGMARWDPPELDEILGRLWEPNCDLSIIPDYVQAISS